MRMIPSVHASDVTSMHCGGTIERIYEPENSGELLALIKGLDDFHILGGGTNTLFDDTTISKPVIRLGQEFNWIVPVPGGIQAGAATPMKRLVSSCTRNCLMGIEFMAGIPGLLGGALSMNAGTPEMGIMDVVAEIEVVDRMGVHTLKRDEISYGYRTGGVPPKTVVTSARLQLKQSTKGAIRQAIKPYVEKKRKQPKGFSSGSIFRNLQAMPAGLLIDRAGLKGFRIGGAKVSEVHANFIINDCHATTSDIKELIAVIKERVRALFEIELKEEVRIIGQ
jgi:UDP-N-acetylmuramate dehydrogenase